LALDPLYPATAIEGALRAGRVHRRFFRQQVRIHKKGPIDLVTAADLEAEREFRDLIAERFPAHCVLGEEAGAGAEAAVAAIAPAPVRWIIDPLDGTTNFAHGVAFFCVSIALEIRGAVELGVVYDPIAEELFTAERGGGAWLNGARMHVSDTRELVDALLCTGFPYTVRERRRRQVEVFAAFLGEARAVRRLGSAALDLCHVAAGRFDGFWEEHLQPWDVAAAALIVQEAGGRLTRYDGTTLDPFRGETAVSNGWLHDSLLSVIQRVASGPPPE
jgi:myo-inositol-1(or 4)-monophosphatase